MSLPLMFYERDIITKKKPFVPPSVPSTNKKASNESSEKTFHGRIVVNGEKAVEKKVSAEPAAEKPKPRRRKVVN